MFGYNLKTISPLGRALIFGFILVYTQVRQVRNQYIIIHIMKKNHLTRTSVLKILIGLFSFFLNKLTITYNDTICLVLFP